MNEQKNPGQETAEEAVYDLDSAYDEAVLGDDLPPEPLEPAPSIQGP